MSAKPFASSADLEEKTATLEQLAEGVYAYTAQGDPNVGCVIGEDSVLAIEARATPVMAQRWIDVVRTLTHNPFGDLVLTHYHAVRVLGARRVQRAADHHHRADGGPDRGGRRAGLGERARPHAATLPGRRESIPGLTRPTDTFATTMTIDLGNRVVELRHLGRGHTTGDLAVWLLQDERICFAGDLVEAQAAQYMGDSHIADWSGGTLDNVAAPLGATSACRRPRPGRPRRRGGHAGAIADTRAFLAAVLDGTREVGEGGGTPRDAYGGPPPALRAGVHNGCRWEPERPRRYASEHPAALCGRAAAGSSHPQIWTVELAGGARRVCGRLTASARRTRGWMPGRVRVGTGRLG